MEQRQQPGPVNPELLTQQEVHRSKAILEGGDVGSLRCRSHLVSHKGFLISDHVVDFIRNTQFFFIHRLVGLKFNVDLISALVERWRPETHSFHLTVGEATVTLQDVQVLLGLRIRGDIVSGTTAYNWRLLVTELLRKTPGDGDLKWASLRIGWLLEQFSGLLEDANEDVLHQYVRAYLLILMATIMFPDKSGNDIQVVYLPLLRDLTDLDNYSWGSVVVATLYRNLYKASNVKSRDIGGPLILLQLWAWERINIGRPTLMGPINATHHGPNSLGSQHQIRIDSLGRRWLSVNRKRLEGITTLIRYRDVFDTMRHDRFIWQPYIQLILSFLPGICYDDSDEWAVMAPMICFDIVEWPFPNRVARQFGWKQDIPLNSNTKPICTKLTKGAPLHEIG
ncbi:serine/threonine-protein phosphatase 7 long form homolog [Silene latifolia]|uniref:serine/threonine-protein phosphatase 7 long form homolog n=1 Tax=Silene latifolia TaxID=37657 RepID=UPI003D77D906